MEKDESGHKKEQKREEKKEEKEISVTDEDVENTIMDIRKSRARKINLADHAKEAGGENMEEPKEDLPEINDEFVRSLGPFKDVEDFKTKLRENLKLEKENQHKEKTRLNIVEKLIEATDIDVPDILVDLELNKIIYRMESDITQMGLKFEDYLKHLNKTMEDLRKDFHKDALKKAKLALILNEIAKIEKIKADEAQVVEEVNAILEHYKEADPEQARVHAENVLTNEKIFQFLESQQDTM